MNGTKQPANTPANRTSKKGGNGLGRWRISTRRRCASERSTFPSEICSTSRWTATRPSKCVDEERTTRCSVYGTSPREESGA